MYEVWLRSNRRAIWLGMAIPALLAAIGLWLLLFTDASLRPAGAVAIGLGIVFLWLLLRLMPQPRLAYEPGYMLVYLRLTSPIRVPIDAVECFFLGSGPLKLSDHVNASHRTVSLIIRMAEKATNWADRPVKPALGRWAEGYIMIHGAWCEPLSLDVVSRLNVRLHNVQHGIDATVEKTA